MRDEEFKIVIGRRGWKNYLKTLHDYREVLFVLITRDVLVRYKQTVLGLTWALLRPLLTMAVFTIVFGKIANLPGAGLPYPVLVFCGLVPWFFFSQTLGDMTQSVVGNSTMVSKVYFPRIMLPLAPIGVGLVDFIITFLFLMGLVLFYGLQLDVRILALPFFMLIAIMACTGLGLFLSALNVQFRDVRYIIPFLLQFGLFISPVGFSSSLVPDGWRFFYALNPMVGVIEGFRWSFGGAGDPQLIVDLVLAVIISTCLLVAGFSFYRHTERRFADII